MQLFKVHHSSITLSSASTPGLTLQSHRCKLHSALKMTYRKPFWSTHIYRLLCTVSYKYAVLSEQNGAHQKHHHITNRTTAWAQHTHYLAAHSHAVQSCCDSLCKDCPQHCEAGGANLHCSCWPIWHVTEHTSVVMTFGHYQRGPGFNSDQEVNGFVSQYQSSDIVS